MVDDEGEQLERGSSQLAARLKSASRLRQLYGAIAPPLVTSERRLDDWPVLAASLIARAHYTLESIEHLQHRPLDAAVLVRTLYEHVVTFAWLAINPRDHVPRFVKSEWVERNKAASQHELFAPLPASARFTIEEFRQFSRGVAQEAPNVFELARDVDSHWGRILIGFDQGKEGFVGQFPVVYRHYSAYAHPSVIGTSAFVSGGPPTVTIGRPFLKSPLGIAPVLFAQALLIAADQLGWPARDDVFAAFGGGDSAR